VCQKEEGHPEDSRSNAIAVNRMTGYGRNRNIGKFELVVFNVVELGVFVREIQVSIKDEGSQVDVIQDTVVAANGGGKKKQRRCDQRHH
jgi:hypothetical protein